MPTVLPMTRVEAYLAYKAGVIPESDLKPTLKTNFYSGLEHWLAYWCGLCDNYPKDANNNPKWYTEEEYYVAYLCGVASDYPVNCYRRVGAYLRHIISYRWPQPDKPLTREEYYLSLINSTIVVNPTPSSDIYLSPTTSAGPLDLRGVYGDTSQETLTGKNKLGYDYASVKAVNAGSDRVWDDTAKTMTYHDVIYKFNDDGTILVTGTASSNSFMNLCNPLSGLVSATEYVLNGCPSGGSASTYSLRLYTSGSYEWDAGSGLSFTYGSQDIIRINMSSGTAAPAEGLLFKPMIRLATVTDATYEQYCGGSPSPNPDYPSPVNVVTGGQTVQIYTTNKFKTSGVVNLACGNTILASDSYRGWYCPVTAGDTYLVSRASASAPGRFRISFTSEKPVGGVACYNDAGLRVNDTHDSDTRFKVTVPAGMTYLFIYLSNSNETITDDMGIEVKMAQNFDINLGKNLFNYQAITTLAISGTGGGTIASASNYRGFYTRISAGTTYTLSRASSSATGRFRIAFTKEQPSTGVMVYNQEGEQGYINADALVKATVTAPKDMQYIFVYLSNTDETVTPEMEYQIEVGSQVTSYASFFTPIELCKIVSYQDSIIHATGKNLFDFTTVSKITDNTTDITFLGNGWSQTTNASGYGVKQTITGLSPSTNYTLSWTMAINTSSSPVVRVYKGATGTTSAEKVADSGTLTAGSGSVTFNTAEANTVRIYIYNNVPGAGQTTWTDVQMEEGARVSDYEPCGNGWYKYAEVGKVVLDGSENWSRDTTSGGETRYFRLDIADLIVLDAGVLFPGYSNYYSPATGNAVYLRQVDYGISCTASVSRLRIRNKDIEATADFQTWLSTHNTTVYYALANPTYTQIANLDLIAQLEAINHVYAGDGSTSISVVTPAPNLPALLTVAAYKQ